MSYNNIIRVWKDENYRQNMSDSDLAKLPDHPSGLIELSQSDLGSVAGGQKIFSIVPCSARDACPSSRGCTSSALCP